MTPEELPDALVEHLRFAEPVFVTRPSLPPLDHYAHRLEEVWRSRWLTNFGLLHGELEERLEDHLGLGSLELVSSGTAALMLALRALGLSGGEVITTPFTFPATLHVLGWCGLEPVFCDIEERTLTLDPERARKLITDRTVALLGVHVYGTPCDTDRLSDVAGAHGLKVVYDAAHAFGVRWRGRSILEQGDASILSFHATKLFSTAEGGAAYFPDETARQKFRLLRNFGIVDEETVAARGINAKLSELHAAFGLLHLDQVGEEVAARRTVAEVYEEELADMPGLQMVPRRADAEPNHAYFPVLIDRSRFGLARDELHSALRRFNVFSRRYFFPLCSEYPVYADLPSAAMEHLPIASRAARRVLCLPIFGSLGAPAARTIARIIRSIHEHARGKRLAPVDADGVRKRGNRP